MSAVVDVGTRPLRVFGPVLLVAGILMLLAAVFLGVRGATSSALEVLTEGPAGQSIALPDRSGAGSLQVMAQTADGASPTAKDVCDLSPSTSAQVSSVFSTRTTTYQGRSYRSFRKVGRYPQGSSLTCTGPALERVLVAGDERTGSLLPAALFGFVGLGAVLLGALGLRLRR